MFRECSELLAEGENSLRCHGLLQRQIADRLGRALFGEERRFFGRLQLPFFGPRLFLNRRRRRKCSLLNEAGKAIRNFGQLRALRQRQIDHRKHRAEQQADQQRNRERLPKALVVFAAASPRHDRRAIGKLADLAVDDPFELALLFLPAHLECVVFENLAVLFFTPDLFEDGLATALGHGEAASEFVGAAPNPTKVIDGFTVGGEPTPEEFGRAEFAELLEPAAHHVERLVLASLGGQFFQLGIDGVQLAHEPIQPLARLLELHTEYFFVFRSYFVHEIT